MKRNVLAILVLIGLVGYGAYDYVAGSTKQIEKDQSIVNMDIPVGIEKGQRAPNFTLIDLNGKSIQLAEYRGKKVLVNFWATWCPPCRAEMPHMQKFYEDFQKDTVILGVNLTSTEEKIEDIRPFIEEFGLTFPIVLDEEGDTMMDYGVIAYPTTYFINEQGIIREIFRGAINYEIMQNTIGAL